MEKARERVNKREGRGQCRKIDAGLCIDTWCVCMCAVAS